jgi:4-amino-4-deoxy-L-arabinose transferase-like glycosyltransferase
VTTGARTRPGLALVLVPIGLLVVAAALRLPNLATRGTWDADQGHDMLMLRGLVRDGAIPLLGPPTSIGDVHHGAVYYYLLSPAAFLTGGDSPLAVVTLIALAGIAAVLVTWWLARSIGGPAAGLVAGLAMAVSTSAVDESTFIWNPNLIALSSAVALAGAWQAWTMRDSRWWLLAGVGTAVTMQCHVLGVTMLPTVGALFVADARSRAGAAERRRVLRFGLGGLAIVVLAFVPLAIHELTTNFSEINAALVYIRSGGDPTALGPLARFLVIGARVVSWPLTGLFTDAALAGLIAKVVVITIVIGLAKLGTRPERQAARWLGLGLLWTAFALTFISPSLSTVIPGLPNDHYHAFADPMVFTLVGLGAGALWRVRPRRAAPPSSRANVSEAVAAPEGNPAIPATRTTEATPTTPATSVAPATTPFDASAGIGRTIPVGPAVVVVGLAILIGFNLLNQPPITHPDGGFPAAETAAARILAATGNGTTITLRSLPDFKSTEAYAYPLIRAGASVQTDTASGPVAGSNGALVVICDSLFEDSIGAPCGGPAEATVAPPDRFGEPVDRFLAAPGRTISIYRGALAFAQ